jgi:hypothetical protein
MGQGARQHRGDAGAHPHRAVRGSRDAWRHTRRRFAQRRTTEATTSMPGVHRPQETLTGKPALVKNAPSRTAKRPTSAASRCSSERGCPLADQAGLDSGGRDARHH